MSGQFCHTAEDTDIRPVAKKVLAAHGSLLMNLVLGIRPRTVSLDDRHPVSKSSRAASGEGHQSLALHITSVHTALA